MTHLIQFCKSHFGATSPHMGIRIQFSLKMSQLLGSEAPQTPITHTFSVSSPS